MAGRIRPEAAPEPIPASVSKPVLAQATPQPVSTPVSKLATSNGSAATAPMATDPKAVFESLVSTLRSVERSLERLLKPHFELIVGLAQQAGDQITGLLQWLANLLGGPFQGGKAPGPMNAPLAPVPAPPPAPPLASSTGNSLSNSRDSGQAFLLLLGLLALSSIPLLEGSFSCPSREPLKPGSLCRPAIERPG
jgi:hypothetical protein